jgi:hypothetical protein
MVYIYIYENGEWKSRINRELEEMSKGENIVKWIKGQSIYIYENGEWKSRINQELE